MNIQLIQGNFSAKDAIEKATQKLVDKIYSCCPQCRHFARRISSSSIVAVAQ